jgi:DNA-binding MarR family transcriptional regulator
MSEDIRPILFQGPGDLWILGEKTASGVRISTDDLTVHSEGEARCRALELEALIEIDSRVLTMQEAAILVVLRSGAHTLGEAASATKIRVEAAKRDCTRLSKQDLVVLCGATRRITCRRVGLTSAGIVIANRLIGYTP